MSYCKRITEEPATDIPPPFARSIRAIFNEADGGSSFTVATSFIAPHARTDRHVHGSAEVMYIMSGRGHGAVGTEAFPLEPETVFWAPAGVEHQIVNTGDETLKVLAIYVPGVATDFIERARAAALQGERSGAGTRGGLE